jgi:septum site-determining protein MinD
MARLIANARENFEYTIIDCPAGLGAGFRLAAQSADTAVIVATGDVSAIRDASVAAARLTDMKISEVRLLVNRFDGRRARRLRETVDDLIDDAGARLIGIVREDARVPDAVSDDTPLVLYGGTGAARDFLDTARRLTGEELPI